MELRKETIVSLAARILLPFSFLHYVVCADGQPAMLFAQTPSAFGIVQCNAHVECSGGTSGYGCAESKSHTTCIGKACYRAVGYHVKGGSQDKNETDLGCFDNHENLAHGQCIKASEIDALTGFVGEVCVCSRDLCNREDISCYCNDKSCNNSGQCRGTGCYKQTLRYADGTITTTKGCLGWASAEPFTCQRKFRQEQERGILSKIGSRLGAAVNETETCYCGGSHFCNKASLSCLSAGSKAVWIILAQFAFLASSLLLLALSNL